MLGSCWVVFRSEWHSVVAQKSMVRNNCCLFHISCVYLNPPIPNMQSWRLSLKTLAVHPVNLYIHPFRGSDSCLEWWEHWGGGSRSRTWGTCPFLRRKRLVRPTLWSLVQQHRPWSSTQLLSFPGSVAVGQLGMCLRGWALLQAGSDWYDASQRRFFLNVHFT